MTDGTGKLSDKIALITGGTTAQFKIVTRIIGGG